ncbi:MAG TPA: hydroxymethylbilane synthase [Tepidisphaeraceae bacterium]|jgi:hydroxymethylbilane synthase
MAVLRLGTRGSLLAVAQSRQVAEMLELAHAGLKVELITIKTTGDRIQDRPLADIGGKGLFTKEIELALLAGEIDFAVHSFKDVPVTMPLVDPSKLMIACVPRRADPFDVLATRDGRDLLALPEGAKVGTASPRRAAQLLDRRADLRIEPIRGNIDTRLRKMRDGEYDAVLLAKAGLVRAGLFDAATMITLTLDQMVPAAGQGALALQTRDDDAEAVRFLIALHHPPTADAVTLEREVVRLLEGDCHSPIAAYAQHHGDQTTLSVVHGTPQGIRQVEGSASGIDRAYLPQRVVDALNRLSR